MGRTNEMTNERKFVSVEEQVEMYAGKKGKFRAGLNRRTEIAEKFGFKYVGVETDGQQMHDKVVFEAPNGVRLSICAANLSKKLNTTEGITKRNAFVENLTLEFLIDNNIQFLRETNAVSGIHLSKQFEMFTNNEKNDVLKRISKLRETRMDLILPSVNSTSPTILLSLIHTGHYDKYDEELKSFFDKYGEKLGLKFVELDTTSLKDIEYNRGAQETFLNELSNALGRNDLKIADDLYANKIRMKDEQHKATLTTKKYGEEATLECALKSILDGYKMLFSLNLSFEQIKNILKSLKITKKNFKELEKRFS